MTALAAHSLGSDKSQAARSGDACTPANPFAVPVKFRVPTSQLACDAMHDFYAIYEIRGPAGVYYGVTNNFEFRRTTHRWAGGGDANPHPLYEAMRRDGIKKYRMKIVCETRNRLCAYALERFFIYSARDAGEPLLNTFRKYRRPKIRPSNANAGPRMRLLAWRGERTLVEAARVIGISATSLYQVESGQRPPGLSVAYQIYEAVGIALSEWADVRAQHGKRAA